MRGKGRSLYPAFDTEGICFSPRTPRLRCSTSAPNHSSPSYPFMPSSHLGLAEVGQASVTATLNTFWKSLMASFPCNLFLSSDRENFPLEEHGKNAGKIIFASSYRKTSCHLPSQDTGPQQHDTKLHSPYLCSFPLGLPDKTQEA